MSLAQHVNLSHVLKKFLDRWRGWWLGIVSMDSLPALMKWLHLWMRELQWILSALTWARLLTWSPMASLCPTWDVGVGRWNTRWVQKNGWTVELIGYRLVVDTVLGVQLPVEFLRVCSWTYLCNILFTIFIADLEKEMECSLIKFAWHQIGGSSQYTWR